MTRAEEIANYLQSQKVRFFASDNISKYLKNDDLEVIIEELEEGFKIVMDRMVIDWRNDPNSKGTPERLAKMYVNEIMRGRYFPSDPVTAFPNDGEHAYTGMLVVRAEITSLCAHHMQPMKGIAYIGIMPNHKVIGLSKYIRLAQWVASRGTLQEELCNMMADEIMKAAGTEDVGVYIAATHGCVENRGVRAHSSLTQTTVLHGKFLENAAIKEEFYKNITLQEQFTGSR